MVFYKKLFHLLGVGECKKNFKIFYASDSICHILCSHKTKQKTTIKPTCIYCKLCIVFVVFLNKCKFVLKNFSSNLISCVTFKLPYKHTHKHLHMYMKLYYIYNNNKQNRRSFSKRKHSEFFSLFVLVFLHILCVGFFLFITNE